MLERERERGLREGEIEEKRGGERETFFVEKRELETETETDRERWDGLEGGFG